MKVLGYLLIAVGCLFSLTFILIIPGLMMIGVGALLHIAARKQTSGPITTSTGSTIIRGLVTAFAVVIILGSIGAIIDSALHRLDKPSAPIAVKHSVIKPSPHKRPQPLTDEVNTRAVVIENPSKYAECDKIKAASIARQFCEEQVAAGLRPETAPK